MDQSFSTANLRRIWDSQTRKGHDLLNFYPDVRQAYENLRQGRKDNRASVAPVVFIADGSVVPGPDVDELKRTAESKLTEALSTSSETLIAEVESGAFDWGLHAVPSKTSRLLFGVGKNASAYFADKQLQRNIAALLPARLSSRQSIISALARTLANDLPKVVVRLDVEAFYDNVDHSILRERLTGSGLSPTSLGLIGQLLDQMARITGTSRGLPAGIGLSAKLAEFYLCELDTTLRDAIGIQFYARYVDDIVLVKGISDSKTNDGPGLISWVAFELQKVGLTLNAAKRDTRELSASKELSAFEFLGYSIAYKSPAMKVDLTDARHQAIKTRIDRTLDAWDRADKTNHGRRRLLLDRLRFLAGNTRLSNNKRNAMVGIYFSNPHVSSATFVAPLDDHLKARLAQSSVPPDLQVQVDAISFVSAFERRTVRRFTVRQMLDLRGAWRG